MGNLVDETSVSLIEPRRPLENQHEPDYVFLQEEEEVSIS